MFAFFLLPAVMAIGGSLVSVPIIIHLINRMRFRKVRWAAMEFLLKSQKRNRRRLIIEQILLLMLRCLLVLLAAFLMSRFLGCDAASMGFGPKSTAHFVVIDDTMSMKDHWQDEKVGGQTHSFAKGKDLVLEIARKAVLAGAAQDFRVVRITEPTTPLYDEKLTDEGIRRLEETLAELKGTDLANKLPDSPEQTKLVDALEKAKVYFSDKIGRKMLHVVSDFRHADWNGPSSEKLQNTVQDHCKAATDVNLVDCAFPLRNEKNEVTGSHDNIGIVDLRPDSRIAAVGMPVQFTVTVQNFSNADRENTFVTVKVDGQEKLEASSPIPKLPPNGLTKHTFQTTFTTKGMKQITATLPKEAVGLDQDNKRFAVVEVRDQVEILIVDGAGKAGTKEGGDTYYLQTVFTSGRGFKVITADSVNVLDGSGLDRFASVYLLNVPDIKSDKGRKNLEDYVKDGGSVCFFLGDKVRDTWYNEFLFKGGDGVFPVPLDDANHFLYQKLGEKEKEQRRNDGTQKVFIRDRTHPAFADWYDYPWYFEPLVIEGYWRVKPRDQWKHPEGKAPQELVTLPNEKPIEGYRDRANGLIKKLIIEDPNFDKFKKSLDRHQRGLRDALSGSQLALLAQAFQAVREDQGDKANPGDRPNLVNEYWTLEETKDLKAEIDQFLKEIQFGDPLVVERRFGRGKSVAFLTTAGTSWNDWGGKSPATVTYAPIMMELQKYLTNTGDESNLIVGSKLTLDLDASRYEPKMHKYFQPEIAEQGPQGAAPPPAAPGVRPGLTDRGEQPGAVTNDRVRWLVEDSVEPGVYLFDFTLKPESLAAQPKIEQKAFVFNVDTLAEGDLKRAVPSDLERNPVVSELEQRGKIKLYTANADFAGLAQKQQDASESPWLYLIIMAVLVFEQALAVHLSFHLKGSDTQTAGTSRGPTGMAA